MVLVLGQATCLLTHPNISSHEKQILRKELANELVRERAVPTICGTRPVCVWRGLFVWDRDCMCWTRPVCVGQGLFSCAKLLF